MDLDYILSIESSEDPLLSTALMYWFLRANDETLREIVRTGLTVCVNRIYGDVEAEDFQKYLRVVCRTFERSTVEL
jgi:hypothetical protein